MKNKKEEKRKNRVVMSFAVLLLSLSLITTGCAGRSETVHKETVSSPNSQTVTTVHEEKVKTDDGRDFGILGGAFHVVGEIIAFPFEVIAGVFRFIF